MYSRFLAQSYDSTLLLHKYFWSDIKQFDHQNKGLFKSLKKWCLLWNYFSLYLTCQIPTHGLISFLILNTTSKTMCHCRNHSLHFQLEAFYQFHFARCKSNCKHELIVVLTIMPCFSLSTFHIIKLVPPVSRTSDYF